MSKKKYKGLMIQNKNSKRNYELIEYYEAGISLSGTEGQENCYYIKVK